MKKEIRNKRKDIKDIKIHHLPCFLIADFRLLILDFLISVDDFCFLFFYC